MVLPLTSPFCPVCTRLHIRGKCVEDYTIPGLIAVKEQESSKPTGGLEHVTNRNRYSRAVSLWLAVKSHPAAEAALGACGVALARFVETAATMNATRRGSSFQRCPSFRLAGADK